MLWSRGQVGMLQSRGQVRDVKDKLQGAGEVCHMRYAIQIFRWDTKYTTQRKTNTVGAQNGILPSLERS